MPLKETFALESDDADKNCQAHDTCISVCICMSVFISTTKSIKLFDA